MIHGLSKNAKIITVHAGTTASASSTLDSAVIDRSGYESALLFGSIGTTASDNLMEMQCGTASSTSGMGPILNSAVNAASSTSLLLDVVKLPAGKRYIMGKYVRATASAAGKMVMVLYNGRRRPVDNATSTQNYQFIANGTTGASTSTSST